MFIKVSNNDGPMHDICESLHLRSFIPFYLRW